MLSILSAILFCILYNMDIYIYFELFLFYIQWIIFQIFFSFYIISIICSRNLLNRIFSINLSVLFRCLLYILIFSSVGYLRCFCFSYCSFLIAAIYSSIYSGLSYSEILVIGIEISMILLRVFVISARKILISNLLFNGREFNINWSKISWKNSWSIFYYILRKQKNLLTNLNLIIVSIGK